MKNYIASNIFRLTVDNIVYIMHAKCKIIAPPQLCSECLVVKYISSRACHCIEMSGGAEAPDISC